VSILLYWHTLRHLQRAQLAARVVRRWKIIDLAGPTGQRPRASVAPIGIDPWRECAFDGKSQFTFLNETRAFRLEMDWNRADVPKLWLYNLHYFDWINARHACDATASLADGPRAWIMRWIAENPAPHGNGWEPYPLSLRIVNWIKWLSRRPAIDPATANAMFRSLELQAHVLTQRLETDLLGNHVFENAKALIFAGCFFEGTVAGTWLIRGANLLGNELDVQILPDGGHFELSPMYHSIVLEGVLDLLSLQQAYPEASWAKGSLGRPRLEQVATSMFRWLSEMTHPDGQIAFFNDAAIGIAADWVTLRNYAKRLGLNVPLPSRADGVRAMSTSGYIRVDRGLASAILDVAKVGPDHIPGHGHADTLTFEWSLAQQRVVVNSGISLYGESAERLRQRGTAAHNTVIVDDQDSSEMWRGFRVGRRAYPRSVAVDASREPWLVSAAHDGYSRLSGAVTHRRQWAFGSNSLVVADRLEGRHTTARARFHFHPRIEVDLSRGREGRATGAPGLTVRFEITKGRPWLEDSTYHPEFGRSIRNQCLVIDLEDSESSIAFTFQR
jgi:uncharacterized heparinase superfamily protein